MISIVVPAYNEVHNLGKCIASLKKILGSIPEKYEIIIAEDGSTDGTDELAKKLSDDPRIIHMHSDVRFGKGFSISNAFKRARGEILFFTDADLSADLKDLPKLLESVNDGYQIVIGSRMLRKSETRRSFVRNLLSRMYNLLVRVFFQLPFTDIQCGFKAFDRKILEILPEVEDKGFFWDTELIVKASRSRFKIKEVAISWKQADNSKVNLISDPFIFLYKIIKLKLF